MILQKNDLFFRLLLLFFLWGNALSSDAQDTAKTKYHAWWREGFLRQPAKNPKARLLPLIHVYKNKFVNANGDTILFRGLSVSDPDKVEHQGHWNKKHFEKIKEMGTMLVRIPVHPVAWRERTPAKYLPCLIQRSNGVLNWACTLS